MDIQMSTRVGLWMSENLEIVGGRWRITIQWPMKNDRRSDAVTLKHSYYLIPPWTYNGPSGAMCPIRWTANIYSVVMMHRFNRTIVSEYRRAGQADMVDSNKNGCLLVIHLSDRTIIRRVRNDPAEANVTECGPLFGIISPIVHWSCHWWLTLTNVMVDQ